MLINEGFSFSPNGKIVSLAEDDVEEFEYIEYDAYDALKEVLNKRENVGKDNYVVIWEKSIDDSLLVRSKKLETTYEGYNNHYEINFSMGYGVRIKEAERYTDYGYYLNRLVPIFIKNSVYICEINCCDYDC